MSNDREDLVVVVADLDCEVAVRSLLKRPQSIGIRNVTSQVFRHPRRDPGCFLAAHDYLRTFCGQFSYAMTLFDRHGCGHDDEPRMVIERDVEDRLSVNGWNSRCAAIVLDPELEIWVWSDSPIVSEVLGWSTQEWSLRQWLADNGHWPLAVGKPQDPKTALRAALRRSGKRPSAALFQELAERVSLSRCADPAFTKFCSTLRRWFAVSP